MEKITKFILGAMLLTLTSHVAFGFSSSCSGLEGEYQLTKVVKDKNQKNDCAERLILNIEDKKLIVMDANGPVLAEVGNKNESGKNSMTGVSSDWNRFEKLENCSARVSHSSESFIMLSSIVHSRSLRLKLDKRGKLKVRSLNFFGSNTLDCNYQKESK